ncbi:Dipeptidase B [Strongyloides ratti]|uniref:Dipeptidase B n=1 Tax=Strongyloides ratti TaxID=34506 RepID=A0A090KV56_STRRB|nr:Dipeptidase B [Strongyloides ratti]CEF61291.1 Dipeptidase B [Strongyloides ratti]
MIFPLPTAIKVTDTFKGNFDGIVIVSHSIELVRKHSHLEKIYENLVEYSLENKCINTPSAHFILLPFDLFPIRRLIYSNVGSIDEDFDDVRKYKTAAINGIEMAISSGMKNVVLITLSDGTFQQANLISAIGAIHPIYLPLTIRERNLKHQKILESLNVFVNEKEKINFEKILNAFSVSLAVCRDVGDSDPIRMTPLKVGKYMKDLFDETSSVKIKNITDLDIIEKDYPLMFAVNRSANDVPEHRPCLIKLEYKGPSDKEDIETIMLVGKGVTIDTGGINLKIGTAMNGMSRDKYGSAVVAGFFAALDILKPKNLHVIANMPMVRNSIGSNGYTCDEIIQSRSGKYIRIMNTDAEGRISMLDSLTELLEMSINYKNPHLFTLATLTGHEILAHGEYAAMMDNGPALKYGTSNEILKTGEIYGQPLVIDRLQPEDFQFNLPECKEADLRQGNTLASVVTLRGHQAPGAFLIQASGLMNHQNKNERPVKFTHIDMGSCMGDFPNVSFPNPLVTFIAHYILPRI